MSNTEIKKAVILSGIGSVSESELVSVLSLDIDGRPMSFSGIDILGTPHSEAKQNRFQSHYVDRVLDFIGVASYEEIKGKGIEILVRIRDGWSVVAIGKIDGSEWFCPRTDFNWDGVAQPMPS